jgi:hypothetical protein
MKIKKVNPVAKASRNMSGAGAHKSKKDYRRQEKHRKKEKLGYYPEESVANKLDRLILLEAMQANTNSASNWFMYEEEIQVIKQYLSEVEV